MSLLRKATAADCDAVTRVWHAAWHDAHTSLVPARLLPHRGIPHFREMASTRMDNIHVAVQAEQIIGFVGVDDDEVELLFVSAAARGTGIADVLMSHAVDRIAQSYPLAYLMVVDGNARARRFYERHGFRDAGPFAYEASIPDGRVPVPHRRYERPLRRADRAARGNSQSAPRE